MILDSRAQRLCIALIDLHRLAHLGGGADLADHGAVRSYWILNVLRNLHVIEQCTRPKFACRGSMVRADEGGLVDLFVSRSSCVESEVIG